LRLAVVGLGYAGLSTAACLAKRFDVVGVDVDGARVARLNRGEAPMHEKGLPALLKAGMREGTLVFSNGYDSLRGAGAIFITVGTPSEPGGAIDLSQVKSASVRIGKQLSERGRPLVVIKSTVTPGTATRVVKPLLERESGKGCGEGFDLCSNPEFLREGAAIEDTLHPDRIIIGPSNAKSGVAMRSLYRKFYGPKMPTVVETTPENAELIKYASNTFLATKISFINFIGRLCAAIPGADVNEVASGMGLDPRIAPKFLQAGPGFGGACFPKDSRALIAFAQQLGVDDSILRSVVAINDTQPDGIVSALERVLGTTHRKEIAVLGAAFKEQSDDVRESRSIVLAKSLLGKGASVRICDPEALEGARREIGPDAKYYSEARECIRGADAAVVMTAWGEFKRLKPRDFIVLMRTPVLFDARRLYDPDEYRLGSLKYLAVGLGEPA
jgi:UDPglucose 6-dehydrogenase